MIFGFFRDENKQGFSKDVMTRGINFLVKSTQYSIYKDITNMYILDLRDDFQGG